MHVVPLNLSFVLIFGICRNVVTGHKPTRKKNPFARQSNQILSFRNTEIQTCTISFCIFESNLISIWILIFQIERKQQFYMLFALQPNVDK